MLEHFVWVDCSSVGATVWAIEAEKDQYCPAPT